MVDVTRRMARRAYFDVEARQALRHELGNVEQALHHLIVTGNDTDAVTMYGSIGPSWFSDDGPTMERWTPQIRRLVDQQDPAAAAPARLVMGMAAEGTGERGALSDLRAALEGFLSANRAQGAASAAFWLARELALDGSDHQTTGRGIRNCATTCHRGGPRRLAQLVRNLARSPRRPRRRPDSRRGGTARGDQSEPALRTQSPDRGSGRRARRYRLASRRPRPSAADSSIGPLLHAARATTIRNSPPNFVAASATTATPDITSCRPQPTSPSAGAWYFIRGSERVIVETLCAATHYLDASGRHTLARATRASIAAWPANEKGLTNTVTEALGHAARRTRRRVPQRRSDSTRTGTTTESRVDTSLKSQHYRPSCTRLKRHQAGRDPEPQASVSVDQQAAPVAGVVRPRSRPATARAAHRGAGPTTNV